MCLARPLAKVSGKSTWAVGNCSGHYLPRSQSCPSLVSDPFPHSRPYPTRHGPGPDPLPSHPPPPAPRALSRASPQSSPSSEPSLQSSLPSHSLSGGRQTEVLLAQGCEGGLQTRDSQFSSSELSSQSLSPSHTHALLMHRAEGWVSCEGPGLGSRAPHVLPRLSRVL